MPESRTSLDETEQKEILRRCWYSHDGHWFVSVAAELGLDAANRLNRRALRAQGRTEARRFLKAFGIARIQGLEGFLRFFEATRRVLIPPPTEARLEVIGERSYAITVERCFVHESVVRAGNPDGTLCAVFDRIAGWHDGAGLPLAEEPPARPCEKAAGRECRRILTVR